jgi:hypothetical protein
VGYITVTANDEASLRAAVASAVAGDYVLVPPGTYALSATITATTGCKVIGSGATGVTAGPTIITVNGAFPAITIDASAAADYGGTALSGFEVFDCHFSGAGGATYAILLNGPAAHQITGLNIQGCDITGFGTGVRIGAANTTTGAAKYVTIRDTGFSVNSSVGIQLINCSMARIERCAVLTSGLQGIVAQTCPTLMLYANSVDGNNTTNNVSAAQVSLQTCTGYNVVSLAITNMPTNTAASKTGLELIGCIGGVVQSMRVEQSAFQSNSIGIHYSSPPSRSHVIDALASSFITTPVLVDSGCDSPFMRSAGVIQLAP